MDLNALRTQLEADLAVTGLRVTRDPRKAHAPCVLVGPVTEVRSVGQCAWEVEIPCQLVAPAPGDDQAVSWLAENIAAVMDAAGSTEALLGTLDVGGNLMPVFETTVTVVTKE